MGQQLKGNGLNVPQEQLRKFELSKMRFIFQKNIHKLGPLYGNFFRN